jgi:GDP-L-fucose synthase
LAIYNPNTGADLLSEAWRHSVKKLVTVGTVCAYPSRTPVPFSKTALWDGYPEATNAPYGVPRKTLPVMGQAYRQPYGFRAIYLVPTYLSEGQSESRRSVRAAGAQV